MSSMPYPHVIAGNLSVCVLVVVLVVVVYDYHL